MSVLFSHIMTTLATSRFFKKGFISDVFLKHRNQSSLDSTPSLLCERGQVFELQYLYLSTEGVNLHRILLVASDRCQIQLDSGNNNHVGVRGAVKFREWDFRHSCIQYSHDITKNWFHPLSRGSILVCFLGRHSPGSHLWHS